MDAQLSDSKKRPTQRQRSEESKKKLIAATIECLIQLGYSNTSTQEICNRAGLSKGGLFRQFPTRLELMIATGQCIYADLLIEFAENYIKSIEVEDPVETGLKLIRANHAMPEFQAGVELQIASRTDSLLAKGMAPVIEHKRTAILALAKELFPEAAEKNPRFESVIDSIVLLFEGEMLSSITYFNEKQAQSRFNFIEEIARKELMPEYPTAKSCTI